MILKWEGYTSYKDVKVTVRILRGGEGGKESQRETGLWRDMEKQHSALTVEKETIHRKYRRPSNTGEDRESNAFPFKKIKLAGTSTLAQ